MTQSSPQGTTTIQRHHHVTLCTGRAQEDYDFHTKVLSLKSVKKTALYDGVAPIYHLYYGNDLGQGSRRKGRSSTGRDCHRASSRPLQLTEKFLIGLLALEKSALERPALLIACPAPTL
jgi:catechol 2,3-dioxygenase-like lactoylglutathione lyase family enzyme